MRRHLARALPALVLLICLPLALAAFSRLLGPRVDEEALALTERESDEAVEDVENLPAPEGSQAAPETGEAPADTEEV